MSHRVWNVGKRLRVRGDRKKEEKEGQEREGERERRTREGREKQGERKERWGWRDEMELERSFPTKMPLVIK